jgi:hypothetical protein
VKGHPDFKNIAHRFRIVPKDCLDEAKPFEDRLNWADAILQSLQTSVNRDLASCKERVAKLRAEVEKIETDLTKARVDLWEMRDNIFERVLSVKVEAQT